MGWRKENKTGKGCLVTSIYSAICQGANHKLLAAMHLFVENGSQGHDAAGALCSTALNNLICSIVLKKKVDLLCGNPVSLK